jgi:hypothetical protein
MAPRRSIGQTRSMDGPPSPPRTIGIASVGERRLWPPSRRQTLPGGQQKASCDWFAEPARIEQSTPGGRPDTSRVPFVPRGQCTSSHGPMLFPCAGQSCAHVFFAAMTHPPLPLPQPVPQTTPRMTPTAAMVRSPRSTIRIVPGALAETTTRRPPPVLGALGWVVLLRTRAHRPLVDRNLDSAIGMLRRFVGRTELA